ncbi:MAG: AAA family ATPase [Clostridia bacterium]|nr:AAA family ATPase [Clostridia bacterium]
MSEKDVKNPNIPQMNVGRLIEELGRAYCGIINSGVPLRVFPSVMLWGPPGVGKSQAIRQLAKEIERNTGKTTHITDVRLLLFNPIDLRGIPTANEDKTLAVWLKPQIFQMDPNDGVVNFLFLDEISAAPQSVQAAAYQITLDRVIGEHKLPENCIVIAAGNRTTDKSVAVKMPKALSNRLLHIEVESSFKSWKEWAVRSGVNDKVVGFLSFRPQHLISFDAANADLAFATPRAWEMVSNILNHVDDNIDKVYSLIAGVIGTGLAIEFRTWSKVYDDLPDLEDIFDGKQPDIPKGTDAMYALCAAMTAYARDHKDDMRRITNSVRYAERMPPDFSAVLFKDYMYIEPDYRAKLLRIPEFSAWLSSKGRLLHGAV